MYDASFYSMMLEAFKPYLFAIIGLLVLVLVFLFILIRAQDKTNQLISASRSDSAFKNTHSDR